MNKETKVLRDFLHTMRVATHTALAAYELGESATGAASGTRFTALAAKGAGAWRFPADGLLAGDGLLSAHLVRDVAGLPAVLNLQALGLAGLALYAGRNARVSFGPFDPEAWADFDAEGRARISLMGLGLEEIDLASFAVTLDEP